MDVWLSVWYLKFYCDPRKQWIVISKILVESILNCSCNYGNYVEKYLYTVKEIVDSDETELANIDLPESMAAAKPLHPGTTHRLYILNF